MRIYNDYSSNCNSIYFGNKVKSVHLIETLIGKNIESQSIDGFKAIVSEFQPQYSKASGHQGYYRLAQKLAKRIVEENPDNKFIQEALKLKKLIDSNDKISQSQIKEFAAPILEKQGKEIDITLK